MSGRPLRVLHCPVNMAGIAWENVQALRRKGVEARLLTFKLQPFRPHERDILFERPASFLPRQAAQLRMFARLLPRTDIFHFYFGLTLVPHPLQFPLLRLTGRKSLFHFLGSDIRGKTPEQLAYARSADARIVGSYDALRWVPDAEVVPPGLDLREFEPAPPSDRKRPVILHAPSSRRRKGTEEVIAACAQLPVDLRLVEGVPNDEARRLYREADIVVEQLHAGWHGIFGLEAMALGKPVVTFLHDEAVRRTEEAYGVEVPIVSATAETLVERPSSARRIDGGTAANRGGEQGLRRARARRGRDRRPPARDLLSALMLHQLLRLARHSAIYGLGGLLARILAVVLLPLYTRYLTSSDYGAIGTLIALTTVLAVLLRLGTQSAFFRFYFDSKERADQLVVVRTAFWFTMTAATVGLILGEIFADEISQWLFDTTDRADLVRASFVGLWAQMNYGQLTSLFRVEQRSTSYVIASMANVLITISASILLVVGFHEGALGVIVGNFLGTLTVYLGLLAYRREQLGLQFDWQLFKRMEHFGLPLLPSALALWAINFSDRFFLTRLSSTAETGIYQIGVQVASVIVFLLMAFRLAWPAFAYSIEDDREARRTYPFVLTYLIFICSWLSLALGLLAPWIVRLLTTPQFYAGAQVVALLAFAATAYAGYAVVVIGVGRARQTRFNWIVTGAAAALNIGLNLALIPEYGQIGAGIATLAAYSLMFVGMTWNAHRLFPVPYQWRRVVTVALLAVGLTVLGKELDVGLGVAIALVAVYPLLLALAGFYLPAERAILRRLIPAR